MPIRTLLGKAFAEKGKKLRQRSGKKGTHPFHPSSRKGQLQIGVTMMVLFVFIILLMLSLIIYFRFTYDEIREDQMELLDQKYSSLLTTLIGLPEFRCSKIGVEEECLDATKLEGFKENVVVNNQEYYDNLFGNVKGIEVEILEDNEEDFEIYGEMGDGLIYAVPV